MTNKELVHVWASQTKQSGKGNNMFFEGKSIYSYGHHFEIARFIDERTVLFNSNGYSNTTAKHKSYVRSAINHLTVFEVPSFSNNHEKNLEHLKAMIENKRKIVLNCRTGLVDKIGDYEEVVRNYNQYVRYYGLKKQKIEYVLDDETLAKLQLKQKEIKRKALEKRKIDFQKWLDGDTSIRAVFHEFPVRFRVINNEIWSSHGARVTVKEALQAIKAWNKNELKIGDKIGHYTIDAINGDNIRIGCHEIENTAILELQSKLIHGEK